MLLRVIKAPLRKTLTHCVIGCNLTPPAVSALIIQCCLSFSPPHNVESVREAVGRRVKLTLRRKVQLEVKGDKLENRVLVSERFSYPNTII